ncbi:MAG: GHKL domain-containing protein [Lachnospiraceae bacterium]|nr:GHKL domain-containing protein [Lachnospiraceae bacterium]
MFESICVAMYWMAEMTIHLLFYRILYDVRLCDDKKRIPIIIGTCGVIVFFLMQTGAGFSRIPNFRVQSPELALLIQITSFIIIPTFFVKTRRLRWYLGYIAIPIISTIFISLLMGIYAIATNTHLVDVLHAENFKIELILDLATIVILLLFLFIENKRSDYPDREFGAAHVLACVLISIGGMFSAGLLENTISKLDAPPLILTIIEVSIYLIIVVFTVILSAYARESRRNMELKLKQVVSEKLIEEQEKRVTVVLEKDNEIRKFRHDYKNHLIALRSYAEEGDIKGLKDYLITLDNEAERSEVDSFTGIIAVDSIIQNIKTKMDQHEITMEWKGSISHQDTSMTFDLSVIFMNLLQNAFEAARNVSGKEKTVHVSVYDYEGKAAIEVQNPYSGEIKYDSEHKLASSKLNKTDHGFGLGNVRRVVDKRGGDIDIKAENGLFTVFICI